MKSEEVVLQYPNLGNIELCSIICFSDAAFANLKNGSSQGGFIIFLYKSHKNYATISWKSRKIQQVVRSTLAAETFAMEEALEECYIIRSMLLEIFIYFFLKNKKIKIKICYQQLLTTILQEKFCIFFFLVKI